MDFAALGGRMIEHVASPDGDYYRSFGGDPQFTGDDVTMYYVNESGVPCMLERCTRPSSRAEFEQMRAKREQRRQEREAAIKALNEERRRALLR